MSRLVVVSYAINGRGMGHLVRQLAILRWVRRLCASLDVRCEPWILTSSEADTLARREGVPALKLPSKAMMRDAGLEPARYLGVARTWVMNAIAGLRPDLLLVDTFPAGSFGELIAALELAPRRALIARRVREGFAEDDAYRALLPLYDRHLVPDGRDTGPILLREREELLPRAEARRALGVPDDRRAVYVSLGGGGEVTAPSTLPPLVERLVGLGWHVVVGAGPLYLGPERRGPGITWIDRYVPMELFPGLDAAVSAGGYNAFHELMFAGVPTVFLPQTRIADDQAERCRRAEAAGAGRLATGPEAVPAALEALLSGADGGDGGEADAAARARALVPKNGARDAAVSALELVLPPEDLAAAVRVLGAEALGFLGRQPGGSSLPGPALELVRWAAGPAPTARARRLALREELAEAEGDDAASPRDAEARVRRAVTVIEASRVPLDTGLVLVRALERKFPQAPLDAVLAAVERLVPAWARFDDWMGAVSLLRAVPSLRGVDPVVFADAMVAWLATEEDLFDALRAFSRLEAGGQRPVLEVLESLRGAAEAAR